MNPTVSLSSKPILTGIFLVAALSITSCAGTISEGGKVEEEARLVADQSTVDPEAYSLYLQGHKILWDQGLSATARSFLAESIRLDPNYAPTYADLAFAVLGGFTTSEESQAASLALIEQAIALDAELPTAYVVLGILRTNQARWQEADDAFRHALSLAPNSRETNVELGWFLVRTGRLDQAIEHMELGLQLDPLSTHSYHSLASVYYYARRYSDALAVITRGLRLEPGNPHTEYTAAKIHLQMGNYEQAINSFGGWDQINNVFKGLLHVA
ncbi:MAG: tetratricopeptide repeat protein, partial [Candidatus Marinimicrobia bacterium]|nr:tetratricopeptide repeat protein [Candidatus Neomarinimicrobiota bacterium]